MPESVKDAIGDRGQLIFTVLMGEFDAYPTPRFRPAFFGDKWPGIDFVVQLEGVDGLTPYFFVQVRATAKGYTKKEKRLNISMTQRAVRRLSAYPAPVYVAGIDVLTETVYLIGANGKKRALPSLRTDYPLNRINRDKLWQEVSDFWQVNNPALNLMPSLTAFSDTDWK